MSNDASPEVLALARSAVLRAVHGMTEEGAESAIDEDTLMRVVPLLERHDPRWLMKVLADRNLPLAGRKQVHAFAGELMPEPGLDPGS